MLRGSLPSTAAAQAATCSSGHPRPVSPIPAMPSSVVNRTMNLGTSQNPASPGSFASYSGEMTVSRFIGTRTCHLSTLVTFMVGLLSLTPSYSYSYSYSYSKDLRLRFRLRVGVGVGVGGTVPRQRHHQVVPASISGLIEQGGHTSARCSRPPPHRAMALTSVASALPTLPRRCSPRASSVSSSRLGGTGQGAERQARPWTSWTVPSGITTRSV